MSGDTVIIGLGNPLLSDDGVGIAVAMKVAEQLQGRLEVTVKELHTGGIRLMEAIAGFRRAVVVDAMVTGGEPGTIHCFGPDGLLPTKNSFSSHDTDFATACSLGRLAGLCLPESVSFWGIEARDYDTFGSDFSPAVATALPRAVQRIAAAMLAQEGAE